MKNEDSLVNYLNHIFKGKNLRNADTLLIVPPFTRLNNATLGVHILQACAKAAGHRVAILYASMLFAKFIGEDNYYAITFSNDTNLMGDRVFANAAYGLPTLGHDFKNKQNKYSEDVRLQGERLYTLTYEKLYEASHQASLFATQLGKFIGSKNFSCVGCTTMFNQTAASIALLNHIKANNRDTIAIIGGANCAGDMAKGIASLSTHIDYIFNGESEVVFVDLLTKIANGEAKQAIVDGIRCDDLDSIPTADFANYYSQVDICNITIDWATVHMPYESSRGCWWGQKHHCTFCGVYEMRYRAKSPDRVIEELSQLLVKHRSNYVNFTDDIMPQAYFKNLLPRFNAELPNICFFINQKANLSFDKVKLLASSGVYDILPGIETLSTPLLTSLDKGITARQNIQLMRYAKSCHLYLSWYFLYGIPEEKIEYYQEFITLLPMLTHLHPPVFFQELELMRFGLYVAATEDYAVTNVTPLPIYRDILPATADIENLAYYYRADYRAIHTDAPDLLKQIDAIVHQWRQSWFGPGASPPVLEITQISADQYMLADTREVNQKQKITFIGEKQAAAALVGHPLNRIPSKWETDWAIQNKLAIVKDQWIVPLATASADLMENFEIIYKKTRVIPRIAVESVYS